ncbi:NAD-aldehyde dehydrogenase [Mycena polygramma]|nr:NAD-aldehyde dehydrogenase [Mycena polygramma]
MSVTVYPVFRNLCVHPHPQVILSSTTMASLVYTSLDDIDKIHAELRAGFNSGKTKSIAYRKFQLLQLAYLVKDNAKAMEEALMQDLGRPAQESQFMDITSSLTDIMSTYNNMEAWVKPEKPAFTIPFGLMRPVTYKEPKGVVLLISPFNYPVNLTLVPLCAAIASGNAAGVKPSESTPATAALFAELFPRYMDPDLFRVVNGAIPQMTKLLDLMWDHIFFIGSGRVGKIVSAAAAKHLTPVTLELGGKGPVFIDPSSDLQMAAKRILWGKFINAGQTCTAPDYIIVPRTEQAAVVEALKRAYAEFYPETTASPPLPPQNVAKLVTPQAFKRVNGLLQATKGTVVCGGQTDEARKYIAPTIVKDVPRDDALMSEEIFGPVLPIVPVEDLDAAIAYVNAHDHPLALFVFSQNDAYKSKVFGSTQSGMAVANSTVKIGGVPGLPFGGIGPSGSGYHTGKYGFDTFTHLRASVDMPGWIDKVMGFRFPPYTSKKMEVLHARMDVKVPARPKEPPPPGADAISGSRKWIFLAVAVAIAGGLAKHVGGLEGLKGILISMLRTESLQNVIGTFTSK